MMIMTTYHGFTMFKLLNTDILNFVRHFNAR
jgi:hypothetical protein